MFTSTRVKYGFTIVVFSACLWGGISYWRTSVPVPIPSLASPDLAGFPSLPKPPGPDLGSRPAPASPIPLREMAPALTRAETPATRTFTPAPTSAVRPEPLPPPASASSPHAPLAGTEREVRLQALIKDAENDPDPRQAQRTWLTVAGYLVGNRDWKAAEEVYARLKVSPYPEISSTVLRNLDVVRQNQAILAEEDPGARERLQIELALTHQQYGHEQAAKRLLRHLQENATQESLRHLAAERLASYVSPPLPALPPQSTTSAPSR
jgi:hypothetical protein